MFAGAAAGQAEADNAGEADSQKADKGEYADGGDEHGDEQEQRGGGGAEDGVDDAEEDADESQGSLLAVPRIRWWPGYSVGWTAPGDAEDTANFSMRLVGGVGVETGVHLLGDADNVRGSSEALDGGVRGQTGVR